MEATPLPRVWEGKRQRQETNKVLFIWKLKINVCQLLMAFWTNTIFFLFPVFFFLLLDLLEVISDTESAIQLGEKSNFTPLLISSGGLQVVFFQQVPPGVPKE